MRIKFLSFLIISLFLCVSTVTACEVTREKSPKEKLYDMIKQDLEQEQETFAGSSLWYPSSGQLKPVVSSWGIDVNNASTTQLTVSDTTWLNGDIYTNLGIPAGTFLAVDPDGKVIATTSPSGGDSLWSQTGSDIYYDSGNVGIGTTTPTATLSIVDPTSTAYLTVSDLNSAEGNVFIIDENGYACIGGDITPDGVFSIENSANKVALHIDQNGNNKALYIDTESTNNTAFEIDGRQTTSGDLQRFRTDSNKLTGNIFDVADTAGQGDLFLLDGIGNLYIKGDVGIGTTSGSEKLSVEGNVIADGYLEYSKKHKGDALSAIKAMECEAGSEDGDWCDINHDTLPYGVKYEKDYIRKIKIGTTTEIQITTEIDKKTKLEKEVEKEIKIDVFKEEPTHFVGRNLGNSVQLNTRGIQQLIEINEDLKIRIGILESEKEKLGLSKESFSNEEMPMIRKIIEFFKNLIN